MASEESDDEEHIMTAIEEKEDNSIESMESHKELLNLFCPGTHIKFYDSDDNDESLSSESTVDVPDLLERIQPCSDDESTNNEEEEAWEYIEYHGENSKERFS